jgi:hypothetical protein
MENDGSNLSRFLPRAVSISVKGFDHDRSFALLTAPTLADLEKL